MKKTSQSLLILLCMSLIPLLTSCAPKAGNHLTLISYNLRMSGAAQSDGPHCWENRKAASLTMVQEEQPAVMGLQEALPDQLAYLDANLPAYRHLGVGRDDGRAAGETMALYYHTELVEVLEQGTFWLSPTPDSVSMGWDAACFRTCTWARFRLKATGAEFACFNTHLDHMGKVARCESIKLLVEKIRTLVPEDLPVFLTADFNSRTEDPIFAPLKAVMQDARASATETDTRATYNDWGKASDQSVIDHIFVRGAGVRRFAVLRDKDYGAPYISDHYPIKALLSW